MVLTTISSRILHGILAKEIGRQFSGSFIFPFLEYRSHTGCSPVYWDNVGVTGGLEEQG